jgi:LPXTG-motif cell wall-anchored protein
MSFGKHKSWRLLPPLAVMFWVAVMVGLGAPAQADDDHAHAGSQAAEHAQSDAAVTTSTTSTASTASPASPAHQRAPEHKASPTSSGSGSEHGGSGDLTSPQPISKADANSGGANGQCPGGPYCSTRDGSASANGNGGGQATGKPCAGCVGKADNKNPQGQKPDASDHNAGYECDTNHGIARGNPAHTGCQAGTQPPVCVDTPQAPCVPVPPSPPTPPAPQVNVSSPVAGAPAPPQAVVSPATSTPTAVLPSTGAPADLVALTALGVLALAGGVVLAARKQAPALRS